ncbi:disease resistance protein rpp13 [Phtheirospermum japonicum]|uniref:Disease resistance protein rpp13 n=1 Tax=Phtheirospermum japonicum TaxID=374723 RepID=A0A830CVA2_9LAMI|nr:disease resistance protein rpp13 [Phtheirospermum japonicum]
MAAYAALVSLSHIFDQIQNHPRPPISLDKEQLQSLTEKVMFLQDFLERYTNINGGGTEEAEALESRITDAAYAVEDIIESHIVDQIEAHVKNNCGVDFYQGLQKLIEVMDWIKIEVTEIKKETEIQLNTNDSICADSLSGSRSMGQNTMVGFGDVLIEDLLDKLTGQQSNLQIVPIVGMGGIGKTTLARSIYAKPLIVEHFDFRGWATISQGFNSKEILLQVLLCLKTTGSKESFIQMTEHELGETLYKSLSGRRYLIVMDDIWSIEAWDRVRFFFPEYNNGSRIVITTRLLN